ncbi:MAG: hypothetical protein DMG27_03940 [Acidobacteria bacterium]|nr:MAG: hypothetical protein DMG27_03940 [Acidobacteriota bacterium]
MRQRPLAVVFELTCLLLALFGLLPREGKSREPTGKQQEKDGSATTTKGSENASHFFSPQTYNTS